MDPYACDLLDAFMGSVSLDDIPALRGHLVRNLEYRMAYRMALGVFPTKMAYAAFAQASASDTPLTVVSMRGQLLEDGSQHQATEEEEKMLTGYVERLRADEGELRREIVRKWWDRYHCGEADVPADLMSRAVSWEALRDVHAEIVVEHSRTAALLLEVADDDEDGMSLSELYELGWHLVQRHDLLHTNPLTGMILPKEDLDHSKWEGLVSVEEAVRHCMLRDRNLRRMLGGNSMLCVAHEEDASFLRALVESATSLGLRVNLVTDNKLASRRDVRAWRMPVPAFRFALHFIPVTPSLFVYVPKQGDERPLRGGDWMRGKSSVNSILCTRTAPAWDWKALGYDRLLLNCEPSLWLGEKSASCGGFLVPCPSPSLASSVSSLALLRHPVMTQTLLTAHLRLVPHSTFLLYLQFVVEYVLRHAPRLDAVMAAPASLGDKYSMVVVDNRESVLSLLAVVVSLATVKDPREWRVVVACTKESEAFYRGLLPPAWDANVWVLEDYPSGGGPYVISRYNALLLSAAFWEALPGEKVLVVQDDGMLVRPGVEEYLAYDYVGAPWARHPGNASVEEYTGADMVGNGGLSLRDRAAMAAICRTRAKEARELTHPHMLQVAEDLFFARWVPRDGYALCPREAATRFSCEQVLDPGSIGFHKFWVYHPREEVLKHFQRLLCDEN